MKTNWNDLFDLKNDKDIREAIKLIEKLDIVYENFISGTKKLKSDYQKMVRDLVKSTDSLTKAVKKIDPASEKGRKSLGEMSKAADVTAKQYTELTSKIKVLEKEIVKLSAEKTKVSKKSKELNNINKEAIKLEAQLGKATGLHAKENAELRIQLELKKKQTKELARESLGLVSIYQKESKRLNDLRHKYKNVALSQGEGSKAAKRLKKELTALDTRLKRIDGNAGQFQRSVGNYPRVMGAAVRSIRSLVMALGFTGVIFGLVAAVRNMIKTFVDFQKQNAVLAGVLDTTRSQTKALRDDAKRLGAETAKTASEIVKLQIAYARLGFTQKEILNLTEGTIAGSIALNAELDETAELVGAVVNSFDAFDTTDAGKIMDVLTAATQKSALTFEKLETALPIVSKAVDKSGGSFEEMVAVLGILANTGIDASTSATAFRNILLESAKQGKDFKTILDEIANSENELSTAFKAFQKRGAVVGATLADMGTETEELEKKLLDVGGTAQRVADEQLDTLSGEFTLLASAWQGFILGLEDGEGKLARGMRNVVGGLRSFLHWATEATKTRLSEEMEEQQVKMNLLATEALLLTEGTEEYTGAIIELQKKYPDYLGNLDKDTTSHEDLTKAVKAANDEMLAKIAIQQIVEEGENLAARAAQKAAKAEIARANLQTGLIKKANQFGIANKLLGKTLEEQADIVTEAAEAAFSSGSARFDAANSLDAYAVAAERVNELDKDAAKAAEEAAEEIAVLNLARQKFLDMFGKSDVKEVEETEKTKKTIRTKAIRENVEEIKSLGDVKDKIKLEEVQVEEDANKKIYDSWKKWQDKRKQDAEDNFQKFMDQKDEEARQVVEAAGHINDVLQGFFERGNQRNEMEMRDAERARERGLSAAEGDAEQKLRVEQQFDKEKERIEAEQLKRQRKQAIFNKALAVSESIIQTSLAMIRAIGQAGIFGIPASTAFGVMGALRTAAILAQPIPAFAEGTDFHEGGLAWVGDGGGRELIIEPNRKPYLSGDTAELRDLPRGSQVMDHVTTQAALKNMDNNSDGARDIQQVLKEEKRSIAMSGHKELIKAQTQGSQKKEVNEIHQFRFKNGELIRSVKKGSTKINRWNEINSFK